jgi:hypothetical protein
LCRRRRSAAEDRILSIFMRLTPDDIEVGRTAQQELSALRQLPAIFFQLDDIVLSDFDTFFGKRALAKGIFTTDSAFPSPWTATSSYKARHKRLRRVRDGLAGYTIVL